MSEDIKNLMEKLGQALSEVIQESDRVRNLLRQIEDGGYGANLTLAVILGLSDQPAEIEKIIYGLGRTGNKPSVRRLSAFDKRFLRALRIQVPD